MFSKISSYIIPAGFVIVIAIFFFSVFTYEHCQEFDIVYLTDNSLITVRVEITTPDKMTSKDIEYLRHAIKRVIDDKEPKVKDYPDGLFFDDKEIKRKR